MLVSTSNTPIERLYENGLQRERFLPTIDLLQQKMESLHLNGEQDHRLTKGAPHAQAALPLLQLGNEPDFSQWFSKNASGPGQLCIMGRPLFFQAMEATQSLAWFRFDQLCEGPRSTLDYMELAETLDTLLLSHVPSLAVSAAAGSAPVAPKMLPKPSARAIENSVTRRRMMPPGALSP